MTTSNLIKIITDIVNKDEPESPIQIGIWYTKDCWTTWLMQTNEDETQNIIEAVYEHCDTNSGWPEGENRINGEPTDVWYLSEGETLAESLKVLHKKVAK